LYNFNFLVSLINIYSTYILYCTGSLAIQDIHQGFSGLLRFNELLKFKVVFIDRQTLTAQISC
jgi:hypothetical protein